MMGESRDVTVTRHTRLGEICVMMGETRDVTVTLDLGGMC